MAERSSKREMCYQKKAGRGLMAEINEGLSGPKRGWAALVRADLEEAKQGLD